MPNQVIYKSLVVYIFHEYIFGAIFLSNVSLVCVGGKLAPLFNKKMPKGSGDGVLESVVVGEESAVMTAERRNFLFSGVPVEMRQRQKAMAEAVSAATSAEHAPWPTSMSCHVQQRENTNMCWNLTSVDVPLSDIVKCRDSQRSGNVQCKSTWEGTQRIMTTQEARLVSVIW